MYGYVEDDDVEFYSCCRERR